MPAADDTALLLAAQAGDARAFEDFYRRHLPAVTGFHLRRTGQPELAFDLTAETFAALVASLDRFDPARGAAAAWLFTLAANKLRDSLRRGRVEDEARRRLGLEPVELTDADLERVTERAGGASETEVLALLGDLPCEQRDAIVARVVHERSYAEIAESLVCSEAVVRQRVSRGLATLRTRMEETS